MKKRGKDKDIVKKLRRFNGNTLTQMDFFGTYDDDEVVARAEDGSAKNVTPGGSGKKRKKVAEEPPFDEPSYIEETLIGESEDVLKRGKLTTIHGYTDLFMTKSISG